MATFSKLRQYAFDRPELEANLHKRAAEILQDDPQRSESQALCQSVAETCVDLQDEWGELDDLCRAGDYNEELLYDALVDMGSWAGWLIDLSGSRTLILDSELVRIARGTYKVA